MAFGSLHHMWQRYAGSLVDMLVLNHIQGVPEAEGEVFKTLQAADGGCTGFDKQDDCISVVFLQESLLQQCWFNT